MAPGHLDMFNHNLIPDWAHTSKKDLRITGRENKAGKAITRNDKPWSQSTAWWNSEGFWLHSPQGRGWNKRSLRTSTVLNTVALIPSAISYSPFSLGRVKLYSLPGPNILKDTQATVLPSPAGFSTDETSPFFTLSWKTPFPSYNITLKQSTRTQPL